MIIWTWWFTVIIAIAIDSVAIMMIDDVMLYPKDMAKYLAMWSLTVLIAGLTAIYIPWRKWLGFADNYQSRKEQNSSKKPKFSSLNGRLKDLKVVGLKPEKSKLVYYSLQCY